jgi:hypothetical protein
MWEGSGIFLKGITATKRTVHKQGKPGRGLWPLFTLPLPQRAPRFSADFEFFLKS